jgi:hypothetical protein
MVVFSENIGSPINSIVPPLPQVLNKSISSISGGYYTYFT